VGEDADLRALFLVIVLASGGLPGLCGFVGEFLVLIGTFTSAKTWQPVATAGVPVIWNPMLTTAISATAVILAAMYLLTMYQKVMFGPLDKPENKSSNMKDISGRENVVFGAIIVAALALGLWPQPILARTEASVKAFIENYRERLRDSVEGPEKPAHFFPALPAAAAAPSAGPNPAPTPAPNPSRSTPMTFDLSQLSVLAPLLILTGMGCLILVAETFVKGTSGRA
jgi:NADH-quinone oxidoreductase subunit M